MAGPAGDILVDDNVGSRVNGGKSHFARGVRGYAGCQSETGSGGHFTDAETVGIKEADVSCRCCRSGEDSGNHIRGFVQFDISGGPHAQVCRGDDAGCILGDVAAAALQPYSEASGADRRVDCNITCGDAEFQIGARDACDARRKAAIGRDRANRDTVRVDIAETAGCRGSDNVHIVGCGGQADTARAGPQPKRRACDGSTGLENRTGSRIGLQPHGTGPDADVLRQSQIAGDHADRGISTIRANSDHSIHGVHRQSAGIAIFKAKSAASNTRRNVGRIVGCSSDTDRLISAEHKVCRQNVPTGLRDAAAISVHHAFVVRREADESCADASGTRNGARRLENIVTGDQIDSATTRAGDVGIDREKVSNDCAVTGLLQNVAGAGNIRVDRQRTCRNDTNIAAATCDRHTRHTAHDCDGERPGVLNKDASGAGGCRQI